MVYFLSRKPSSEVG